MLMAQLDALAPDVPRVLFATGKLHGEGFDRPPLDTLVLAMPIAWKGTLQQYVGRLHREHTHKTGVGIVDFVDPGHPALRRMWDKRQRGYRAMGYRVAKHVEPYKDQQPEQHVKLRSAVIPRTCRQIPERGPAIRLINVTENKAAFVGGPLNRMSARRGRAA